MPYITVHEFPAGQMTAHIHDTEEDALNHIFMGNVPEGFRLDNIKHVRGASVFQVDKVNPQKPSAISPLMQHLRAILADQSAFEAAKEEARQIMSAFEAKKDPHVAERVVHRSYHEAVVENYEAVVDGYEKRIAAMKAVAPLAVGDIVVPAKGFLFRSGGSQYDDAVVVSVSPFVMVSRETDMLWSSTITRFNVVKSGVADAATLEGCLARFHGDYPHLRVSALQAEIVRLKEWNQERAGQFAVTEQKLASEIARLSASQISTIETFLSGRKYCTEIYLSPLGFHGGESWQVELNWGDGTQAFEGKTLMSAVVAAIEAAHLRKAQQ